MGKSKDYIKIEIGKLGEKLATRYLEKNEYEIVERNFECRQGEIDIIAKDKEELVFIEVKTRTNGMYGRPVDAVNKIKQNHIENATQYYLYKNNISDLFVRIDVIEVYVNKGKYKINHIKQII